MVRSTSPCALALALAACGFASAPSFATTAADLSARVVVDGSAGEYAPDEWVLDATQGERAGDSRWGSDNDVRRVAVTWDRDALYVAVECVTRDTELLLFLDQAPGGVSDLRALTNLRRAVALTAAAADVIVRARPESESPELWVFPGDGPPERIADGGAPARFVHAASAEGPPGVLEIAIPWTLLEPAAGEVRLVVAITGDDGTGCGDAAPNPSALLSTDRLDPAVLDRALVVRFDDDGDGVPDDGVSPRDATSIEPDDGGSEPNDVDLEVVATPHAFAPDNGETVAFTLRRESDVAVERVFVTARVFSISGREVRRLYDDEPRDFSTTAPANNINDVWDGRDGSGRVVPGGIYVIDVTWGVARGSLTGAARTSVAVVR